ncbi:MAG: MptD family putative ECF transporter S component [Eubacteriales bacterium]
MSEKNYNTDNEEVVFEGKKTGKLTAKDLIYTGAFGALYFVGMFAVVGIFGMVPVLYLVAPLPVGVVCATIYIMYVSKVQKFGAILILSALFCIIFMSSAGILAPIAIVAGLLAEFVASRGKYQSKKMVSMSYIAFNLVMMMPYLQLCFMTSTFMDLTVEYYGQSYADAIQQVLDIFGQGLIVVEILLAVVGAFIGIMLANKLFKKHFEKAGLV